MAIQIRRGKESQFVPSQLLPGEFAVTTDTGRVYLCWSSGHVKELASVEELQRMLDLSEDALDALKELIDTLGDQSVLTGLLSDVTTLKADVAALKETASNLKNGAYQTVYNGLNASAEGYVLDARQGTVLRNTTLDLTTIKAKTTTATFTANGIAQIANLAPDTIEGFKPVGIVGTSVSHQNLAVDYAIMYSAGISARIRNMGASAISTSQNITFYVLYVRTAVKG